MRLNDNETSHAGLELNYHVLLRLKLNGEAKIEEEN